jgi:hypothetical protein
MNKFILPAILAVVVVGLIGAFAIGNHSSSSSSSPSPNAKATVRPNPDGLPGLLTSEAPWDNNTNKLADRLDVWGVKFTSSQLGGYTATSDKPLTVYLNGAKYTGDPRQLKLASHQEIAVIYGPAPDQIPSTYAFPSGE